jgi:hypothetical protein
MQVRDNYKFSFSFLVSTMTNAPYSYSYIFKYIIIGLKVVSESWK